MRIDLRKELLKHFQQGQVFSKQDLRDFYRRYEPGLNEGTLSWRIHWLRKKGMIRSVEKGKYVISDKPGYEPGPSSDLVYIAGIIHNEHPGLQYCIWSTEWLNHFTKHQLGSFFTILELEKEMMEMVFETLRSAYDLKAFLKPDKTLIERYVLFEEGIVIVPLISRAPVRTLNIEKNGKDAINVPILEKILVDLFTDEKTFYAISEAELEYIYEHAMREYSINFSVLFNYARRRGKEEQLKRFLRKNFEASIKGVLI